MRYYLVIVLVLLFACSIATLAVLGISALSSGFPGFQDQFGKSVRDVGEVVDQFKGDFTGSGGLTREEQSELNVARFKRRENYMNEIAGEVTAKVMPDATGYQAFGVPGGFEVDENTYDEVDAVLSPYLSDPNPEIRAAALMCLPVYMVELPALTEHCWHLTNDPDAEVQYCAAGVLLKAPLSPEDAPRVIALLENEEKSVKHFSMRVMGEWEDARTYSAEMDKVQLLPAVPRLFELVRGDVKTLADIAASVLRSLGPHIPEQLGQTIDLLEHGNTLEEKRAVLILRGMGQIAMPALPQLVERLEANPKHRANGYLFQVSVAETILAIDPALVDMVALKMANNIGQRGEDGWKEMKVLNRLGADASAAIPILRAYQVGQVNQVYLNATEALGHIAPDDPEVIAELLKARDFACEYERYWIIDGLGRATTNFELARPGLEWFLETDRVMDQERAQEILDLH